MLIKEIMCQKRNENLVQENDMYNKIMATISFLSFIHRKYFMSEIIFITILHNKTELILIWYWLLHVWGKNYFYAQLQIYHSSLHVKNGTPLNFISYCFYRRKAYWQ